MADLKISQLTGATTPLAGTEVLPIVQSSSTKKVAVSDLTAGRDVATAALTSTKTSAGAVVDVATIQNANSTAGTEAALFFAPTSATGNIRGARISAVNDGNNIISLKVYTGTGATITAKYEFTDDGNIKQLVANKGVNFTANTPAAGMTGQLLNWYEEGTFTPTISSGITSVTYSTQNGAYTRIGRLVTFALRLELSAGTAAAAIVRIGGLPFTANISFRGYAGSWAYAAGTIINSLSTNLPTLNVDAGSTTISFYNTQGAAFNGTDLSTAANFSVDLCGMYYA